MSSSLVSAPGCGVCGATRSPTRILEVLDQCPECGFVYASQDDPDALLAIYDDAYFNGEEYPDYLGEEQSLRRSMRGHLAQMGRSRELRGSLLEVGSAYGFFLDEARKHFTPVVGIDVCAGPVAHARKLTGLDVRCTDLLRADFGNQRFDVICMWDTIEHVGRPDAVLARVASLLKPTGSLFLTTGDLGSLNARLRGRRWRQIHPPSHVNYFTRASMRRVIDRVGMRVTRIETTAYYHTLYNVLGSLRLRGGPAGTIASGILRALGERFFRRVGFWINLRDIMFVEARLATSEKA